MGKVAVAAGCGVIAFGLSELPWYNDSQRFPATYLSSALVPIGVAALVGWIVAHLFLQARSTLPHM